MHHRLLISLIHSREYIASTFPHRRPEPGLPDRFRVIAMQQTNAFSTITGVDIGWLHHSNRGELRHGETACRVAAQRIVKETPGFFLVLKTVADRATQPLDHNRSQQQQPSPASSASRPDRPAPTPPADPTTSLPAPQHSPPQLPSTSPQTQSLQSPDLPAGARAPSPSKAAPQKRPSLLNRSSADKSANAQTAGNDPRGGRKGSFFSNLSTKFSSQPRSGQESPGQANVQNPGSPSPPAGATGGQSSPAPVRFLDEIW